MDAEVADAEMENDAHSYPSHSVSTLRSNSPAARLYNSPPSPTTTAAYPTSTGYENTPTSTHHAAHSTTEHSPFAISATNVKVEQCDSPTDTSNNPSQLVSIPLNYSTS